MRKLNELILMLMISIIVFNGQSNASFSEELTIIPLAHHGHVALYFKFSIDWDADIHGQHFNLCPKSFCSLVNKNKIEELHLSLTKGRWNYEKWGLPPVSAPQGAELIVYFNETDSKNLDSLWKTTTFGLSGQFCASLEFMNPRSSEQVSSDGEQQYSSLFSSHDIVSFRPEAQTWSPTNIFPFSGSPTFNASLGMKHSILHGETVCTENLTPWVKLLPCRVKSGLGKLLSNPSHLFNFDYTSLGLHVHPKTDSNPQKRIDLTFTLVVDRKRPPASPQASSFQPPSQIDHFELVRKYLGVDLKNDKHNSLYCPLAKSSNIFISKPKQNEFKVTFSEAFEQALQSNKQDLDNHQNETNNNEIMMESKDKVSKSENATSGVLVDTNMNNQNFYQIDLIRFKDVYPFNCYIDFDKVENNNILASDKLARSQEEEQEAMFSGFVTARRWLVGWGQQHGKLTLEIENKLDKNINISYHQVTPWILKFYFHTIKIVTRQSKSKTDFITSQMVNLDEITHNNISLNIIPAVDRISSSILQMSLLMKAKSKLLLTVDFDLAFLHWTEHPPDAHRGFDVGAGVLNIQIDHQTYLDMIKKRSQGVMVALDGRDHSPLKRPAKQDGQNAVFRIYTEGLVLSLPTPDFSMPYNVITLTSTIMALFFGSMINTMLRRYKNLYEGNDFKSDRPIVVIIRYITSLFKSKQKPTNTQN